MQQQLQELQGLIDTMLANPLFGEAFMRVQTILAEALPKRQKILIAGNGGSAGEAQHFAAAFTCKYKKDRKPYPAIALTTDSSALTAIGNDFSLDEIFKRQVEALGNTGDIFVALSVSGNSKNIISAITEAKLLGMKTIALIGKDGGAMKGMGDAEFIVPSNDSSRVQEMHLVILHAICLETENYLS